MSYIKMYDSFTDGFDKRSKASLRILMILMCHLGKDNMIVNEDEVEANRETYKKYKEEIR